MQTVVTLSAAAAQTCYLYKTAFWGSSLIAFVYVAAALRNSPFLNSLFPWSFKLSAPILLNQSAMVHRLILRGVRCSPNAQINCTTKSPSLNHSTGLNGLDRANLMECQVKRLTTADVNECNNQSRADRNSLLEVQSCGNAVGTPACLTWQMRSDLCTARIERFLLNHAGYTSRWWAHVSHKFRCIC